FEAARDRAADGVGGDEAEAERAQPREADDESKLALHAGDDGRAGPDQQQAAGENEARAAAVDRIADQRRQASHDDQGHGHDSGDAGLGPAELAGPFRHREAQHAAPGESEAERDESHRDNGPARVQSEFRDLSHGYLEFLKYV